MESCLKENHSNECGRNFLLAFRAGGTEFLRPARVFGIVESGFRDWSLHLRVRRLTFRTGFHARIFHGSARPLGQDCWFLLSVSVDRQWRRPAEDIRSQGCAGQWAMRTKNSGTRVPVRI